MMALKGDRGIDRLGLYVGEFGAVLCVESDRVGG